MSGPSIVIVGFPSTDFVPIAAGQVKYGAGATSAASIPLKLLCVGMKASNAIGTSVQDAEVDFIPDVPTADTLYGAGSQLARCVQAAVGIQGVQVYGAPVAVPGGATQATFTFLITASQTIPVTLILRIAGLTISVGVGASDIASVIATNVAAQINATTRCPFTAVAVGAVVTATCITPGLDGNSYIAFASYLLCPGVSATLGGVLWSTFTPSVTVPAVGTYVQPSAAHTSGFYYKCTTSGAIGASEPTWPTTIGATVTDGAAVWTCFGLVVTGGGISAGGGSGAENVTNILAYINNAQYDRIALCQNDATNLGRWKTQVDTQAGPLSLILQHVIAATNSTLATATSLAQTTLNDQRFQLLWYLNSETHYTELAGVWAALRTANEAVDPAASSVYDGMVLPGVAPQSQRADWAIHSTLVSALNNGVTPISTSPSGQAVMVRSITTHSLNGTLPDYSCLDTSEAVVPDFVLVSLLLFWINVFKPSNPRVAPDLPADSVPYPAGVAYPALWSSTATSILADFGNGIVQGLQVPPIIYNVANNPVVSAFDPIAGRIMSAVTVQPMPGDHQLGQSVLQTP
jgi:phage tail sheath gpL-like